MNMDQILARIQKAGEDETLFLAREWLRENPGKPVVGFLPAYAPRELVYAAGGLAAGIWGGGPRVEIVHGDAYFQSYICHLPRSVVEMASQGHFKDFSGVVFPSICDVVRNLSGMWRLLFPHQWVKYLDLPQNFNPSVGGAFYAKELRHLASLILGREPDAAYEAALRAAIALVNRQQAAFDALAARRRAEPHVIPIQEFYQLYRSALVLHPEEHIRLVEGYLAQVGKRDARPMDNIRVMVKGAFCEQPPLGMLRTIERAGCYIVNHDFLTGIHWFTSPLDASGDPWEALADGFMNRTRTAPFKYQGDGDRGQALVDEARALKVDGVILAAPSFCDPSLLERPVLQDALRAAGIPYTSFKYAENTGQFQAIKEQAGTFSDSVRLWAGEVVHG